MWNSLPDAVVNSSKLNQFTNKLDRHWSKQDIVQGSTSRNFK